jgi:hypothetical protein
MGELLGLGELDAMALGLEDATLELGDGEEVAC